MMSNITIEQLNDVCGIFETYKNKYESHYVMTFGDMDSETIDLIFSDLYGERILLKQYYDCFLSNGASETVERILKIIDACCYPMWKHIKDVLNNDSIYNIDDVTAKEERKRTTEKTGNNTDNTQNKQNAYDSTTASDTDSTERNATHNEMITVTDLTTKTIGTSPTMTASEIINFTKSNNYVIFVLETVVRIISLPTI